MVSLLKKYTVNLIMRKISQIERHYIKHMASIHPNVNDDPKGKKKRKSKGTLPDFKMTSELNIMND